MSETSFSITKFIDIPIMSVPNKMMTFSQFMQKNDNDNDNDNNNDNYVSDNWGWFIDIEQKKHTNNNNNYNYYRYRYKYCNGNSLKNHLPIPETIVELKSVKSFKNLHDSESLLFEMDEDYKENVNQNAMQISMGCYIIIAFIVIIIFT
jgi:hypothetical protein